MLLIYPPQARTTEPPLGIARLAGFLEGRGEPSLCLDLAREGLDWILGLDPGAAGIEAEGLDTWTRRALKGRALSTAALSKPETYGAMDRYRRAVSDSGRALKALSAPSRAELGLADYADFGLSPLSRRDLLASASGFGSNLFYPFFSRRIAEALAGSGDRIVGLSVVFLSQALTAFAIAGWLRAAHPEVKVVAGGGLITSWLRQGSIAPGEDFGGLFDALIPGMGETGLMEYLDKEAGRLASGKPQPPALPRFADFSSLSYFAPTSIIPYSFSAGCPWKRCSFCPEKAEDSPYSGIPLPRALEQIRALGELHGPGLFHFTDNEVSPLYLRGLADNPPGAPWYGFARFSPILADPAFCGKLAASGCLMLQLGLESGDQKVLEAMGKGTELSMIGRILENLAGVGIATYIYVLFGTPAEDRDSALRTRDFVARHAELIGFLNIAVFNLPAASAESGLLETRPFYEGELSLYREFSHPAGWNRDEVRRFLSRDFEAEPRIRPIVLRNPPVFTSNPAPFFLP
jgi:hypothetical protein